MSSVFRSNDRQSLSIVPALLAAVSPISFRLFYNTPATPATLSFNWLDLASIIRYTMYLCNDSNFDFKALPNLPFYPFSEDLIRCKMGISQREYEKIRRFQRSAIFSNRKASEFRNSRTRQLADLIFENLGTGKCLPFATWKSKKLQVEKVNSIICLIRVLASSRQ